MFTSLPILRELLAHGQEIQNFLELASNRAWKNEESWSEKDTTLLKEHVALMLRVQEYVAKLDRKLKVGFDLHGVLEKYPDEFKPLLRELKSMNVEVWLISGPPIIDIRVELTELDYVPFTDYFDRFESVVDFLKRYPGVDFWQSENGNWWTDDATWWNSKGLICEAYSIDILVDDCLKYKENFRETCETEFILIDDLESLRDVMNRVLDLYRRVVRGFIV
jgi:hypothetical protein